MKPTDLKDFKNKILFAEIHNTERSDSFSELCKEIEFLVKYLKREKGSGDSSYVLFHRLAQKIAYHKNLIALCADLKEKGMKLQWLVQTEENYYEDFFKSRIERGKKALKGLRPLVLEYTKEFRLSRKMEDVNNSVTGKYFEGWYITEADKLKAE